MTFVHPLVLLALLGIPLLAWWYASQQRQRERAASAFVAPALSPSVAPRRPRWRRHAPMLVFAIALAVLIVAAARPQRSVAEPVTDGAIMLADDVSSSMQSTDVAPSRKGRPTAPRATSWRVFRARSRSGCSSSPGRRPCCSRRPTDHALTQAGLARRVRTSGGTAIGDAITTAINELRSVPRVRGQAPAGRDRADLGRRLERRHRAR